MRSISRATVLVAALLCWAGPSLAGAQEPPPPSQPRLEPPGVVPTFGVYAGYWWRRTSEDVSPGFPIWAGVALHPSPSTVSPFVAFGTEINFRYVEVDAFTTGRYVEWVPETRVGVAWLRAPHTDFVNRTFPNASLYFIGGYRLPNEGFSPDGAVRIGAGISSPVLTVLTLAERCTPAPGSLEFLVDLEEAEPVYSIRFGYHF